MLNSGYHVSIKRPHSIEKSEIKKTFEEIKKKFTSGPYFIVNKANNTIIELNGKKTFDTIEDIRNRVKVLYNNSILEKNNIISSNNNFFDEMNFNGTVIIPGNDIKNTKAVMKWNNLLKEFQHIDELEYLPNEINYKGKTYILNKLYREYRIKK